MLGRGVQRVAAGSTRQTWGGSVTGVVGDGEGRPRKSGMEGFKGGVWAVREFSKFGSVYKFQKFRFLGIRKQMFENFWEGL